MGVLDIVLGLLLIYGLIKGFYNGLFIEIASIIALIAGLYGAIHFSYIAGDYLAQNMEWNERYMNIAAFIITFIIIVILVHLAGKLLTKIANFAMLGLLNKLAGAIFGALKVAVIVGALLVFLERANSSVNVVKSETMEESVLYEPIKEIGALVFAKILKTKEDDTLKRNKNSSR
ncbi:CvpA family protein [Maribacter polysaccharolyticus]|uniref:CvpA family protein n=1 Tax=Maribacter polysaccharolyticus TaxID=3020831 RepID=UPI00237EF2AA|nr:CvpA family protein [Maribacter polysaccharolyticus]MDE3743141.1 CvpA family protein [Maribacter polysaccharolyticus]